MRTHMHTSSPTLSTQGVCSPDDLRQDNPSPREESPCITIPKPPAYPHTRDYSHSSIGGSNSSLQETIWERLHYLATRENTARPVAQKRDSVNSRSAKRRRRPAKRRHKPVNHRPVDRGPNDDAISFGNVGPSNRDESSTGPARFDSPELPGNESFSTSTRPSGNVGPSNRDESSTGPARLDSPELPGSGSFSTSTRPSGNAEPTGNEEASDDANTNVDDAEGRASASAYEGSSKDNSLPQEKSLPKSAYCRWLCWICRRPFQISSVIKDNWKCFHQPIVIGRDGDFPPAQRCIPEVKPAIHDCCWEVACKVLECSNLGFSRRIDVIKHLHYLSAFAETTPFDTETNSLDLELLTDSDSMSVSSREESPRQFLLEDILSKVVRLLNQGDRVISIDDLKNVDPCMAEWMILAHSYSVQMNRTPNVRPLLERVVRNLRESDASRFPKAYNFRVAWYNVQQAIGALETIPPPRMMLLCPQLKGRGEYLRYRMSIDRCRRFTFFFYPCNESRHYRLTGVACDGFPIGSCPVANPFVRAIHLPVQPLRGLCIAQTSTGQITAFKSKADDGWSLTWYGSLAHACDVVQIELNETNQDVVFHYDALQKDIKKIIPTPRLD